LRRRNPRINGVSSSEFFSANGISGQAVYNASNRLGIVGELSGYRLARKGRDTTYQVLTPERKLALFRSLFRGREDLYAIHWERRDSRSGYSPAGVIFL
jgi:hypothetical protein